MASDMISRKALVKAILAERDKISLEVVPRYGFGVPVPERHGQSMRGGIRKALHCVETAPSVDAIPIDTVAEMLAELFGEECCCNYNGIDEWLPFLCEHSDTCTDVIGTNGCWKQFIKHWRAKKDGK